MSAPAWALRAAQARTGLDRQGRRARVATCTRCGAPVLRGLDDDRCALPVEADPYPLNAPGEACALLWGRGTYWATGRPLVLYRRDPWQIRGRPADRAIVLAGHVCGQDLAAFHRVLPDPPPPLPTANSRSELPPF